MFILLESLAGHLVPSKTSVSIFDLCQMLLDRTKYQRPFDVGQMSYRHFEKSQISRTIWCGPKCLMNFGAGPSILQGYEVVRTSYSIKQGGHSRLP